MLLFLSWRALGMRHWEQQAITKALKQVLKARKLSYRQLAASISVSEATIKRLFTGSECNVGRLVEICDALNVSFFDLMSLANSDDFTAHHLSAEQDKFFSRNPKYYFFLRMLQKGVPLKKAQVTCD